MVRRTGYDAAAAGRRMVEEGDWGDVRSIAAALIEPVDPLEITRFFEERVS